MNEENGYDVEDEIDELKARIEQLSHKKMKKAEEKAQEYAEMFREKGRKMFEKGKEVGKNVNEFAEDNPWAMMGIGVLVGLTLGMVISKKMKSCKYCKE